MHQSEAPVKEKARFPKEERTEVKETGINVLTYNVSLMIM